MSSFFSVFGGASKRQSPAKPASWLIVGLGNPGARYAATRHNIGWMVCEAFCERFQAAFAPGKGEWFEARVSVGGETAAVILPTTYMNLCGKAAREAQRHFKIPCERIIAVVDEYNFPVGRAHLKNSGSDGGHNGVASMIEELGSDAFARLRCGIDRKFAPGGLVDYVLQPFGKEELAARDAMIQKGAQALEYVLRVGLARAMQDVNSEKLFREQPAPQTP